MFTTAHTSFGRAREHVSTPCARTGEQVYLPMSGQCPQRLLILATLRCCVRTPCLESEHMTRVLVIEDDYDIREVVRIVLTEEGHTVTTAVDDVHALSLLTDSADPFVALVEYHMPQLTGWRVLQNVATRPEIAERHAFIF